MWVRRPSTPLPPPLLGGEVEVETGLEPVQGELARREEVAGRGSGEVHLGEGAGLRGGNDGGGAGAREGRLGPPGGHGGRQGLRAGEVTGEVAGQQPGAGLVGGVERVDEGVDVLAVSAGRNQGLLLGQGVAGVELDGVLVEAEVAVSGVVRVDEGVKVGVDGCVVVVDEGGLESGRSRLRDNAEGGSGTLLGLGLGSRDRSGGRRERVSVLVGLGHEGGRALPAGGDVVTAQDAESLLAGRVAHHVGVAVVADVRVLADPVPVEVRLLLEDDSVLGLEGGSGAAVAGVEALLLQDFGQLGVHVLGAGSQDESETNNLEKE